MGKIVIVRDELVLDSLAQLGALAHPLRQRALRALADEPRTNKQLAALLGEPPARLHFHVRELERAGLIALVEERPKGGVLEKYYRAVARGFRLGPALGAAPEAGDVPRAALAAAEQELARAAARFGSPLPRTRIVQGQARLTRERLARVVAHLAAIDEELRRAAAPGAPEADDEIGETYIVTALLHPLPDDGEPPGGAEGD